MGDLVSGVSVGWLWFGFGPAFGFGWAALLMGWGLAFGDFNGRNAEGQIRAQGAVVDREQGIPRLHVAANFRQVYTP